MRDPGGAADPEWGLSDGRGPPATCLGWAALSESERVEVLKRAFFYFGIMFYFTLS